MFYIKNGKVYTERELRLSLRNISLPTPLTSEVASQYGFSEYVPAVAQAPQPTPEEIAAKIQNEVIVMAQLRLDTFAQTRMYDGILSLCTYVTSAEPQRAAEAQYGVAVRDATWTKLYQILAEVQAGTRPMPTGFSDIESELPTLNWPN